MLIYLFQGCKKPGGSNAWTECVEKNLIESFPEWQNYFGETYKTIEWARNNSESSGSDAIFSLIDFSKG